MDINSIITSISWIEWVAFILGVLYVVYAALEKPICWIFGGISCALWAYATFIFYNLWIDALLQIFYVGMAVWGWIRWNNNSSVKQNSKIKSKTLNYHLYWVLVGLAISLFVGYFFDTLTPAAATYLDSFNTVFSVIATILVVRKVLENWIYWFVIDAISIPIYIERGLYLTAILFAIYLVIIVIGYLSWYRDFNATRREYSRA